MTTIHECYQSSPPQGKLKTRPSITVHNHPIVAKGSWDNSDIFECTNKKDIKKWLKCAKEKGNCSDLVYHPAYTTKGWFKDTKHPATFTYKTNWGDTPQSVREMFNLKPGALRRFDDTIQSATEPYQGKVITFAEEDILP